MPIDAEKSGRSSQSHDFHNAPSFAGVFWPSARVDKTTAAKAGSGIVFLLKNLNESVCQAIVLFVAKFQNFRVGGCEHSSTHGQRRHFHCTNLRASESAIVVIRQAVDFNWH
jgi:hypothetical protein